MEIVIYAPLGLLGYGFPEHSLQAALELDLAAITVDAGSSDPGPYYLGAGLSFTSRAMVKRDLTLLLKAAVDRKIPLLIGTAGGAGGNPHVAWTVEIVREIAAEHNLHFPMATIEAEVDKEYVKEQIRSGRVKDFEVGRDLTEADVDRCIRIVGQMGVEPMIRALQDGAQVVVAGRAFDAALIAVIPLMRGADPGLAYHMGKILECGSAVAVPRESDGAIGILRDDHFLVCPADPAKRCTVELVAAHTLYEKSDPYRMHLPGGVLDLTRARFAAEDDRTVRVSGSRLVQQPYTVKLEGAAPAGYRAICIGGTRDPQMIRQIDQVVANVRKKMDRDLAGIASPSEYQVLYHIYGKNGVMGPQEPVRLTQSHELGLVIEVVAQTQELANTVAALARSATLHAGYDGRMATAGNLALLFTPAEFAAPPVYEFQVYHLLEGADPLTLFPIRHEQVRGAKA